MAIQSYFRPSMFDIADGDYIVDEEQNQYTKEQIQDYYNTYYYLIQYLSDWDNSLFTISKAEYELLPCSLVECFRIFRNVKQEIKNDIRKNKET